MVPQRPVPAAEGRRIVVCDYNALLLSVTGLLRMNGFRVFQAHDGRAVEELCAQLPDIDLLILNTFGAGIDTGQLIQNVRAKTPGLPVLHIGSSIPDRLPQNVPTLPDTFTSDTLLTAVTTLIEERS